MDIRKYATLFKLRICALITVSAVVGFVSVPAAAISWSSLLIIAISTMAASAAASAFNHFFDSDIDAVMRRTSKRPLPSGAVASRTGVLVASTLLFTGSILLSVKMLNYAAGIHLFLGGFVYVVLYTAWLKRRSWTNIIIGGLAGSFAVLAGGASAAPGLCVPPLLLAVVMFFWTPSHFWSFAIFHKEDYGRAGVPMLPNVIGESRTARYILVNTVSMVALSFLPTVFGFMGVFYALAAAAVGAYFIMMNIRLIRETTKENAWMNFKASMQYLGVIFLAVIIDSVIQRGG